MQAAKQAVMDDKMEHGGGNAGIDVRLEQRLDLLIDALAEGALAEAVAAGDVEGGHQSFTISKHEKGQRVDVAGIAHGVKLTGGAKTMVSMPTPLSRSNMPSEFAARRLVPFMKRSSFAPQITPGGQNCRIFGASC